MKQRKTPMRMCVGCREMKPKGELMRVVRNAQGEISVDSTGKAPGRGAYLCRLDACVQSAQKTRALSRALQQKIEAEIWEEIQSHCEDQDL